MVRVLTDIVREIDPNKLYTLAEITKIIGYENGESIHYLVRVGKMKFEVVGGTPARVRRAVWGSVLIEYLNKVIAGNEPAQTKRSSVSKT